MGSLVLGRVGIPVGEPGWLNFGQAQQGLERAIIARARTTADPNRLSSSALACALVGVSSRAQRVPRRWSASRPKQDRPTVFRRHLTPAYRG